MLELAMMLMVRREPNGCALRDYGHHGMVYCRDLTPCNHYKLYLLLAGELACVHHRRTVYLRVRIRYHYPRTGGRSSSSLSSYFLQYIFFTVLLSVLRAPCVPPDKIYHSALHLAKSSNNVCRRINKLGIDESRYTSRGDRVRSARRKIAGSERWWLIVANCGLQLPRAARI